MVSNCIQRNPRCPECKTTRNIRHIGGTVYECPRGHRFSLGVKRK